MVLGTRPQDFRAKPVIKLDLDPRESSSFKYNEHSNYILEKCVTAQALVPCDLDGAITEPGVSPYSIPGAVPLQQMAVVVNLQAIPSKETPPPAHATEEISIANAKNTFDMTRNNWMKGFEVWTF